MKIYSKGTRFKIVKSNELPANNNIGEIGEVIRHFGTIFDSESYMVKLDNVVNKGRKDGLFLLYHEEMEEILTGDVIIDQLINAK